MKIDLKNYLDSRDKLLDYKKSPGPVITISRAYGCDATPIATQLIRKIAETSDARMHHDWKVISKEVIDDVSEELKINAINIENMMDSKSSGIINSMFSSLTSHYGVSDKKIIESLKEVLSLYAYKGKTVIVGRGGAYIARNIPNSLHVRLDAPSKWRIKQVSLIRKIKLFEAENLVQEMDESRAAWISNLIGSKATHMAYDIVLNRQSMNDHEIICAIMALLESKTNSHATATCPGTLMIRILEAFYLARF